MLPDQSTLVECRKSIDTCLKVSLILQELEKVKFSSDRAPAKIDALCKSGLAAAAEKSESEHFKRFIPCLALVSHDGPAISHLLLGHLNELSWRNFLNFQGVAWSLTFIGVNLEKSDNNTNVHHYGVRHFSY